MNWRKHAFLLGHDLIGSNLRSHYREFLALRSMSPAQVNDLRDRRLAALLRAAVTQVPYYRERVATGEPALSDFPVLRKQDIHAHFDQLMEPSLLAEVRSGRHPRGYSWTEVKTGGSTGTPTTVVHEKNFRDWGRASRLFSQELCGFPIGTPFFMLWGSMRDINDARDSLSKRVLNRLLQVHPLNAFLMDDARKRSYVQAINESPIRHLMAYVDAAEQIARFAARKGLRIKPLESLMACAGTVTEEHRASLTRAFGARVHNKYGSRECADMACECPAGGLHIYANGVVLEIVDDHDRPLPSGATGRILVTLLHNPRFPVIRYEIGDMGALRAGACRCGLPLPMLAQIEGRISEFITNAAGDFVSPVYIRHLVGVVHNAGAIERFQFVQRSANQYALLLQTNPEVGADSFEEIGQSLRRDLSKVLGAEAVLAIERKWDFREDESGKFLYVKNLHRSE